MLTTFLIANVAVLAVVVGFLRWYIPRVVQNAVKAMTAKLLNEWKVMCPVSNNIMGRVKVLEAKESQMSEQRLEDKREVQRLDLEIQAAREREAELKRVPIPAGGMGMSSSWSGR